MACFGPSLNNTLAQKDAPDRKALCVGVVVVLVIRLFGLCFNFHIHLHMSLIWTVPEQNPRTKKMRLEIIQITKLTVFSIRLARSPPSNQLRQKNLFNVTKCSMAWQSAGDFLGVKVLRHTKSKKTLYNNFELFRVKDAGIPVEMLDF